HPFDMATSTTLLPADLARRHTRRAGRVWPGRAPVTSGPPLHAKAFPGPALFRDGGGPASVAQKTLFSERTGPGRRAVLPGPHASSALAMGRNQYELR